MVNDDDLRWEVEDEDEDEDALANRYLLFHVGEEEYGIGIENVIEIVGLQKITEVPELPPHLKGVINLRGQVIPVVDVRLRFNIAEKEYNDRTCVVVVNLKSVLVGLIVDQVSEVLNIPEDKISPPPSVQRNAASEFIEGMGRIDDEVKILLNVKKLLFDHEIESIAQGS